MKPILFVTITSLALAFDAYADSCVLRALRSLTDRSRGGAVSRVVPGAEIVLPLRAQEALASIRSTPDGSVRPLELDFKNSFTNVNTLPSVALARNPRMVRPFEVANEMLGDQRRWEIYFEGIMRETFERMLRSGSSRLIGMADEGKISKDTLIEVFKDRFAARGLNISTIPSFADVLPEGIFQLFLRRGPILDNAFGGTGNTLAAHGPYPHLFQLDYLLDDMVSAGVAAGDVNLKPIHFFRFFGTRDGIGVWNDMFDLFGSARSLRATDVITVRYLNPFGPL